MISPAHTAALRVQESVCQAGRRLLKATTDARDIELSSTKRLCMLIELHAYQAHFIEGIKLPQAKGACLLHIMHAALPDAHARLYRVAVW